MRRNASPEDNDAVRMKPDDQSALGALYQADHQRDHRDRDDETQHLVRERFQRRVLLRLLGAEIVLTPRARGMNGAIAMAKKLLDETPGAFGPGQFDNPANPQVHRETTAEEIWRDTEGKIDAFVAGIGTASTAAPPRQIASPPDAPGSIAITRMRPPLPIRPSTPGWRAPGKHPAPGSGYNHDR